MTEVKVFRSADGTERFTCTSCGDDIVRIIATGEKPHCAMCLTMPGWHEDPQMVAMLRGERRFPPPIRPTCRHCGEMFASGAGTGRRGDAVFCSNEHKIRYYSLQRSAPRS